MARPTTIEQTGKRYKGMMLIGTVTAGIGIGVMFGMQQGMAPMIGLLLTLAGLALYGGARFMAWWHHG